ncbi:MAG: glycosyltransferase family 39 protein [Candidatus Omnitrophota bacterium]
MSHKRIAVIIGIALLIKLFLFVFLITQAPESRFQNDSRDYLETAQALSSRMAFARIDNRGTLNYEFYRTPGYPAFLAILQGPLRFPLNAVILVQVLLTLLAGWIVYRAACLIDRRIAFLSAAIVIYDPPVSIYSLQVLAETLFFVLIAVFMFSFIKYLRDRRGWQAALSALALAAATYVRPTSYYLGIAAALFIIYANLRQITLKRGWQGALKKTGAGIAHALIFLLVVYSLLGLWQERNYKRCGIKSFCNVAMDGYRYFGLYKSYSRNKDKEAKGMPPALYYANVTARSFLSLMTRPGPFKYFKSRIVSAAGNAFAYPWMVFWVIGFISGIAACRGNIYYQFLLFLAAYFIAASVGGVSLLVSERFRVPMVPFIAIISSYGWLNLINRAGKKE